MSATGSDLDIEAIMARHTVARALYVGPPLVAIFGALRGLDGALWAAVGVLIVVGYLMTTGLMLSAAARHSLTAYHAAALLGFLVRLGLITATMFAVAALFDVDRVAMGIAALVSYFVLLIWETVAVMNGSERMLEWT